MNLHMDKNQSPKILINRQKELKLIQTAFDVLIKNKNKINTKNILSTPIIDFFGIAGIGKTRILEEISAMCLENNLLCIKLDETQMQLDASQNTASIASAILEQAKEHWKKHTPPTNSDPRTQTVRAIKGLLKKEPVVILLDEIDTSNAVLINWIKLTLHDLLEYNNLFVVLTSKQRIVFENDWFMARNLTPCQLKPLNRNDSTFYLDSLDNTIPQKTREIIFQWTRGYPLAMEVMIKTIMERHFDIEKTEDQEQLITIIIEEVIDKKILADVPSAKLDWYKAHLRLLSIPRRFNLVTMQEVLETYGTPPISKPQSKLEYMGLSKRLNTNTADILYWDIQKAALTIDISIRSLFFTEQEVLQHSLFIEIHQYLAIKNEEIATQVTGADRVRYLLEYLYHTAQSQDTPKVENALISTLQQIKGTSPDAIMQFSEEILQDEELLEVLEKHHQNVYEYIHLRLAKEE